MSDSDVALIFWAVIGTMIIGRIIGQNLPVSPREKRRATEERARREEDRQKREISAAESKQRRNEERILLGEEEWQKKLTHRRTQLEDANRGRVFRCSGRDFMGLLDWQQLEEAVAFLLTEGGWKSQLTGAGSDRGVDIRCERTNETGSIESLVVQVKHFTSGLSR